MKSDKAENWTLNIVNSTLITTFPLHYRPTVKLTYRWGSWLAMSGSWDLLTIAFLGSRLLGNLHAKYFLWWVCTVGNKTLTMFCTFEKTYHHRRRNSPKYYGTCFNIVSNLKVATHCHVSVVWPSLVMVPGPWLTWPIDSVQLKDCG